MHAALFLSRLRRKIACALGIAALIIAAPETHAVVQTFAQFSGHPEEPTRVDIQETTTDLFPKSVTSQQVGNLPAPPSRPLDMDDLRDFIHDLASAGVSPNAPGGTRATVPEPDARKALGVLVAAVALWELSRRFRSSWTAAGR